MHLRVRACVSDKVCVRVYVYLSVCSCVRECVCIGNWPTHAQVCMHSIKNCAFMNASGSFLWFFFVLLMHRSAYGVASISRID